MNAQNLTAKLPRNTAPSRGRKPALALCVLGLLATELGCSGSVETQGVGDSRPKPGAPSNGASAPGPATGAAATPPGANNLGGGSGEQSNDISGISGGASASGGARRPAPRAPRAVDRRADAGADDAGADDAGVVDAGAVDAGELDAGADLIDAALP